MYRVFFTIQYVIPFETHLYSADLRNITGRAIKITSSTTPPLAISSHRFDFCLQIAPTIPTVNSLTHVSARISQTIQLILPRCIINT